jgi:predicted nucleic acid-binding protein
LITLVDTDILIDVALDRNPHAAPAVELLDALERRAIAGFVAWHSIANFHYLVQPKRGSAASKAFILDLLRFVEVATTSTESVRRAATFPIRDFEDALQATAALACGADVIATRNVRDYAGSPVRAVTPSALLGELNL